ncbi:MAG: DUF1116 domain-containing protein [Proteobacteria bacterium]|nr:DUF1116 domain-containing protein [Pseudomonadota bacterium]
MATLHEADRRGVDLMLAVTPAWTGLALASDAISLAPKTLLHAGPPFDDITDVVTPIFNSAILAAVYEGWAKDFASAAELIRSGEVTFKAAQDHATVTPLAAVVSPSMVVQVVEDLNDRSRKTFAPLNGGAGPAMRFGVCTQEVLDKVRWLNHRLVPVLERGLAKPIPLLPLADHGLHNGDDCHGRCAAATEALRAELTRRIGADLATDGVDDFMSVSPPFFLNLWMAASKCIMSAAVGQPDCSLITAMAGNGLETGVQIAGLPGRWFTAPAEPPQGKLQAGHSAQTSLGAIGDSAVVEGLGLGALTWFHYATDLIEGLEDFVPRDGGERSGQLYLAEHTGFSAPAPRVGLSTRAVRQLDLAPIVSLGIVHKDGTEGVLGRGVYVPPTAPFSAACAALRR